MRRSRSRSAARPEGGRAKPYLSMDELADLTPWSKDAIKKLMKRETLQRGRHWFHFGRRIVFKWSEIVSLIENEGREDRDKHCGESVIKVPMLHGGVAYVPAKNTG